MHICSVSLGPQTSSVSRSADPLCSRSPPARTPEVPVRRPALRGPQTFLFFFGPGPQTFLFLFFRSADLFVLQFSFSGSADLLSPSLDTLLARGEASESGGPQRHSCLTPRASASAG